MSNSSPILVSACFCGICCRYDGKISSVRQIQRLVDNGLAIPVCPEVEGGLLVPRDACEVYSNKVITKLGDDKTEAFICGANKVLCKAKQVGAEVAILKERSPSCGSSMIYDGTFSKTLISGQGLTTELLRRHGIRVWSEENVPQHILLRKY